MRKLLAIMIGKIFSIIGKIMHRGSSYPGYMALKIDKDIISKFTLPPISIVVTGSSGKTSTSFTIATILRENGYTVAHNKDGANLSNGLATLLVSNSDLKGKIKTDAFVMEMDERYTKKLLPLIKPKYLVICNITRDQPPRQGHFDYVFDIIKDGITDEMHLILNGDDPLSSRFAINHKGPVTYFGLCKCDESFDTLTSNCLDMVYCPLCHHKLEYDFVSFGDIGSFHCPNCTFGTPKLDYQVTQINNNELTINNKYLFKSKTNQLYTFYNYIAAYSITNLIGVAPENIIKSMEEINFYEKRYSYFKYADREGYILSGKNENAPSYNQAINFVSRRNDKKTIIFGFEYISLRYPYQDISWLYDIDFELLTNIENVICIGPFAYDIATRLYLSGVSKEKIVIVNEVYEIYDKLDSTNGDIYAILNLGTDKKFINELNKHDIKVD